jgi:hypothetical protein
MAHSSQQQLIAIQQARGQPMQLLLAIHSNLAFCSHAPTA